MECIAILKPLFTLTTPHTVRKHLKLGWPFLDVGVREYGCGPSGKRSMRRYRVRSFLVVGEITKLPTLLLPLSLLNFFFVPNKRLDLSSQQAC